MADPTKSVGPFKDASEFATNLSISIALHEAIKEYENAKDSMSKEMAQVQLDILCQVLMASDLIAEA
jgi:hypothetical protein|tara:strand:+ start:440 stop:640 length:201 start_codon:yes stop_codon:yes gene_type:complete